MATEVLTVRDIEQIQLAAQYDRPVLSFIHGLRSATLPAIIEYGCLRWSNPSLKLPDLPDAIANSPLGLALKDVKSDLGLRGCLEI
jgi:hypothetical protein